MIGVFSGHGEYGHQCAGFSQRVLPEQLAKFVRQKRVQRYAKTLKANGNMNQGAWNPKKWPLLTTREFEQCCTRAFSETNKMLRQEEQVSRKRTNLCKSSFQPSGSLTEHILFTFQQID